MRKNETEYNMASFICSEKKRHNDDNIRIVKVISFDWPLPSLAFACRSRNRPSLKLCCTSSEPGCTDVAGSKMNFIILFVDWQEQIILHDVDNRDFNFGESRFTITTRFIVRCQQIRDIHI
jgi:hypothetical protein